MKNEIVLTDIVLDILGISKKVNMVSVPKNLFYRKNVSRTKFDPNTNTILLVIDNDPLDVVFRKVGHEAMHGKQHIEGRVPKNNQFLKYIGTQFEMTTLVNPIECEAESFARVFTCCTLTIIRDSLSVYDSKRPKYEYAIGLYTKGLHADESQIDTAYISVADFNKMQDDGYLKAYNAYHDLIMAYKEDILDWYQN